MDSNVMFDVALGMFTFFASFAIICSTINSMIQKILGARHNELAKELKEIGGSDFFNELKNHALAQQITPKGSVMVAKSGQGFTALQPERFAAIVTDLVQTGKMAKTDITVLNASASDMVGKLPDGELKSLLEDTLSKADTAADDAEAKLKALQDKLATYYDDRMAMLKDWYKQRAQYFLFGIGLVLALGMNIDSYALFKSLNGNPSLRAQMVAQSLAGDDTAALKAQLANTNACPKAIAGATFNKDVCALEMLDQPNLPFGWTQSSFAEVTGSGSALFWKLVGFLITAFAAALGAPFWFDTLRKVSSAKTAVNEIRGTVEPAPKA